MAENYIGLMSGISMDSIDAVLCDLGAHQIITTLSQPIDQDLRRKLVLLTQNELLHPDHMEEVDGLMGEAFAICVKQLINKSKVASTDIIAIGCNGQTIRHRPITTPTVTLQIGDPKRIVAHTGITTVANFQRKDIEVGGESAPFLVPAFHEAMFYRDDEEQVILNIGGIANITILTPHSATCGFDTGPGNTLMDVWTQSHLNQAMDNDGVWAATGTVNMRLLNKMLDDPYFAKVPPKSTGLETFNMKWLNSFLKRESQSTSADIQATLCELTVMSVIQAICRYAPKAQQVFVCGGGAMNTYLMKRFTLQSFCPLATTAACGWHPKWIEAAAFAWFAKQSMQSGIDNLPTATGVRRAVVHGSIYPNGNS